MVKLYVFALSLIVPSTVNAAFRGEFLLGETTQDGVFAELNAETLTADADSQHVSCRVSAWGEWESCDPLTGTQTRRREVEVAPTGKGKACPPLVQTTPCKGRHCHVSQWTPWGACDQDGFHIRTRKVLQEPVPGGRPCPHLMDRKKCRSVDCRVCVWSQWSVCDQVTGQRTRTREVTRPAEFGGMPCPDLIEHEECPVDCVVDTNYGPWSDCVDGIKHRVKPILHEPLNGGHECIPEAERTETSDLCPIDCILADCDLAPDWSECDENGNKHAKRGIAVEAMNGGHCPAEADRICLGTCDPIDCEFDGWGDWTECDVDGNKERKRVLKQAPKYNGNPCVGPYTEADTCPPENCEMSAWSEWSACIDGVKKHTREIIKQPKYHGNACGVKEEEEVCPVDCVLDTCENAEWTDCDDDGNKSAVQAILAPARNGGTCPNEEERACHGTCDPIDCDMSDWSEWSECRYGKKERTRTITRAPKYHGEQCGDDTEEAPCSEADCEVGPWSAWGQCDAQGKRHRTREITKNCDHSQHGEECPPLEETENCDPVNCVVSAWSDLSSCSDDGWRTQTRTIVTPAMYGGTPCPRTEELTNRERCPEQNCVPDQWGPFSPCLETPPYTKTRTREVQIPAKYGGRECVLSETKTCDAVDCRTSRWSDWSSCNENTGKKSRTKTITTQAQYGGHACPSPSELIDYDNCDPVNCEMSDWGPWSTCNNHRRTRTRTVITEAKWGGDCWPTKDTKYC